MTTAPPLAFAEVGKRYQHGQVQTRALEGVSLSFAPASLTAIMGPSGSGKSTLLHLAAGMVQPTAGTVTVEGTDLDACTPARLAALRRRSIGVVFQQYNLLPTLTALENVTFPLELEGTSLRRARATAAEALGAVGVEGPLDRYPDDLSGGQQQRVAIARAIAVPRTVLLADEPTGALDTATGDRIMELLVQRAEAGTAVVVVTHEPRVASFADRIVNVRNGRIVGDTDPHQADHARSAAVQGA